ncbi:hypothetical protein SCHPADRAFT_902932 [Schizopora paradoxa]|uniref:Zn(2)-C6 fungal-type domain-containing protein n=1 Tax=Schizopora paradoxa TaxID=27342 RepID=A0A0H2SCV3_9AGAM|nr:hypothetical protein SCHPADRAFT_902932 [Schizopora paradoxa]
MHSSTSPLHSAKHKSPEPVSSDGKPPPKRSRKAINCEPCRASKLKCDKARPCSSCVLRGTASACYVNGNGRDNGPSGIDPHNEIARMRQSIASLEALFIRGNFNAQESSSTAPQTRSGSTPLDSNIKQETDGDPLLSNPTPGLLAEKGRGGLYAGPTSTATLLYSLRNFNDSRDADDSPEIEEVPSEGSHNFDEDLLSLLPAIHIIDGLLDYYFEYCNWMYRHVNQVAFMNAWGRFKQRSSVDRLLLATLSVIMALAVRYLPEKHPLLMPFQKTREELGEHYYSVSKEAHDRFRAESRSLSLELVELLLVRTHYLTLSKTEGEEIWSIRGELISIGTAMGLHRDPDRWHMPRDVAERRRWAWWHIILLERWQAFLFGRPISVADHHFDTQMPSYVDPKLDPTGRLYQPNIHLFRLANILGEIVDDAVSIRAVPYERVLDRDRELVDWLEQLPKELDLDEYRLARALASPMPGEMRTGVQSVIVRTSFYHIRFTLHRPYAAAAHDRVTTTPTSSKQNELGLSMHERLAQSLDTAASSADKLIQLVGQTRPDLLANSFLAVPTHVHWGPFHCFSAAMFFSFQLIANPEQPGASLFRANIQRALDILYLFRGVAVAEKAYNMLTSLQPLYDGSIRDKSDDAKERLLSMVKKQAFPYHDSAPQSGSRYGPLRGNVAAAGTPTTGVLEPPVSSVRTEHQHDSRMYHPSPTAETPPHLTRPPPYSSASAPSGHSHQSPQAVSAPGGPLPEATSRYSTLSTAMVPPRYQSHPAAMQAAETASPQGTNEAAMWDTSVGFSRGEWVRFVDVMQRTDAGGSSY